MEEKMIDALLCTTKIMNDVEDAPIARIIKDFLQSVHPSALPVVLNRLNRMYRVAQAGLCAQGVGYSEEDK